MTPPFPPDATPRVGVFDSGLGGLSILRAIRERLPHHELLYVADSGNAPYGERGEAFVVARTLAISRYLLEQGAQCVVVACNTATTAAVATLRQHHPQLAIVGVEPGLKPAVSATRNQRIGVMATTGTLRSEKFRLLAQAHAAHVELVLQACPGLAHAIEGGDLDAPQVVDLVRQHCEPLRLAGVDTVVLGCTHYPFVRHHIQAALGSEVTLIDTAEAVARQTAQLALAMVHTSPDSNPAAWTTPKLQLWTSGPRAPLQSALQNWLGWHAPVATLPATVA